MKQTGRHASVDHFAAPKTSERPNAPSNNFIELSYEQLETSYNTPHTPEPLWSEVRELDEELAAREHPPRAAQVGLPAALPEPRALPAHVPAEGVYGRCHCVYAPLIARVTVFRHHELQV